MNASLGGIEGLAEAMIARGVLDRAAYELWLERLTAPASPEGHMAWDIWLNQEWRKTPRDDFQQIADFYNTDAWLVYQSTMFRTWKNDVPENLVGLISEGTRVLDFGCGHGRIGASCAQAGAAVTFADVSSRLLSGIEHLLGSHDAAARCRTIVIDSELPQLATAPYDVVITMDCLEHVQRPIEVLGRLVESLVPGGIMWQTVFFGGHELSPQHLVEHYHLGDQQKWAEINKGFGLEPIEGRDRVFRKVR